MAVLKAESERKDVLLASLLARVEDLELSFSQQIETYELRFRQLENAVLTSKGSCSDEALRTRILSLQRVSATYRANRETAQHQLRFNMICSDPQGPSHKAGGSLGWADSHDIHLLGIDMAAYSGVLVWKVNFPKAVADARSGRKVSTETLR